MFNRIKKIMSDAGREARSSAVCEIIFAHVCLITMYHKTGQHGYV